MRCLSLSLLTCLATVTLSRVEAQAVEPRTIRTPFFTVQISSNDRTDSQAPAFKIPALDKFLTSRTAAAQTGPVLVAPTSGLEELPAPNAQPQQAQPRPFIVPPAPYAPTTQYAPPAAVQPSSPFVLPTTPSRYLTHQEFAASFQPAPGHYEVVLLHPRTHCPVKVCFTLPPGCIKKVNVDRNELEFDYGKFEVELNFKRNGTVEVDLDD